MTTRSLSLNLPSPIECYIDTALRSFNVKIDIKRDDRIHPVISGNKYRKLSGFLIEQSEQLANGIVSMGGPWSNHLHALAKLCQVRGWSLTAIIRGPEPRIWSSCLRDIQLSGAEISFISRQKYRKLRQWSYQRDVDQIPLEEHLAGKCFIPEGGSDPLALHGVQEMCDEITEVYDHIFVAVGTGTTLAGICRSLPQNCQTQVTGVLAVDGQPDQGRQVERLIEGQYEFWKLEERFTFGGFALAPDTLLEFMLGVYQRTGLITEPVYTAKALYALYDAIQSKRICSGSRVLFIHTGGLQGLRGFSHPTTQLLARQAGF